MQALQERSRLSVDGASPPPFQEFLERNRTSVYRFLMVAVGPQHVDDVFQETFLSALRAYGRVREPGKLDRWILTVASRKAVDHHRQTRRAAIPTDRMPDRALDAPGEPTDTDDPLWMAVGDLPPKQRVAVVLRHVLDRPYAETADVMGSTEATARANVHQGTKRLRELMA